MMVAIYRHNLVVREGLHHSPVELYDDISSRKSETCSQTMRNRISENAVTDFRFARPTYCVYKRVYAFDEILDDPP